MSVSDVCSHLSVAIRVPGGLAALLRLPWPTRPVLLAGEELLDDGLQLGAKVGTGEPALEQHLGRVGDKVPGGTGLVRAK